MLLTSTGDDQVTVNSTDGVLNNTSEQYSEPWNAESNPYFDEYAADLEDGIVSEPQVLLDSSLNSFVQDTASLSSEPDYQDAIEDSPVGGLFSLFSGHFGTMEATTDSQLQSAQDQASQAQQDAQALESDASGSNVALANDEPASAIPGGWRWVGLFSVD